MNSNVHIIHIDTKQWNKPVEVINPLKPGAQYLFIGRVASQPNTLAVAETGLGGTRFYCEIHKMVCLISAQCPQCAGLSVPEPTLERV